MIHSLLEILSVTSSVTSLDRTISITCTNQRVLMMTMIAMMMMMMTIMMTMMGQY